MRKQIAVVTLCVFTLIGIGQMGFAKTLVLFSDVSGQLVNGDGSPAAGITLERKWTWALKNKSGTDSTITDADGNFAFGPVTTKSLSAGIIPHQPTTHQEISAKSDAGTIVIWSNSKLNYDLHGEYEGKPLRMQCRADAEPNSTGEFWGTCKIID